MVQDNFTDIDFHLNPGSKHASAGKWKIGFELPPLQEVRDMPVDPALVKLIEDAKAAYRDRDFKSAMDRFSRVMDMDKNQWDCNLYLAMCYYKVGMIQMSVQKFRWIADNCPDKEIRGKALAAMGPVQKEAMSMTMNDLKKPDISKYVQTSPAAKSTTSHAKPTPAQSILEDSGDEDGVEWAPKDNRNFT